jgi:nicotinamide riboside transporter PnuC
MTWVLTVFSIIGVVLNIYKIKFCFFIWAFTNLIWALVDFYHGIYSQAFLQSVYFSLAIFGIIKWKKEA